MKKIILLALISVLALSLFACAPSEGTGSLDEYTPEDMTHKISTGTLSFEENSIGNAIISGYTGASKLHTVEIPAKIGDREVVSIGKDAFYYTSAITGVKLPDTITSIGAFAFAGCKNIKSITIPKNVKSIGEFAFANCESLETVIFEGNALESIDARAFYNCAALKTILLPDSVKSIGDEVFSGCTAITSFKAPASLEKIGSMAFLNCTSLNTKGAVTLNANINNIGLFAFEGLDKSSVVAPEGSYAAKYVNDYLTDPEE